MRFPASRAIQAACLVTLLQACDGARTIAPGDQLSLAAGGQNQPAPPSDLHAASPGPGLIDVTWRDNSNGESGFEMYEAQQAVDLQYSLLTRTGPDAIAASFSGYAPLVTRCYRVRAFTIVSKTKTAYSAFSNTGCATTPPEAPASPSSVAAVATSSSTVTVTWNDNSADEEGFRIERSMSGCATWEQAGTTGRDVVAFVDDGRAAEQTVCYRVTAYKGTTSSQPSEAAQAVVLAGPGNLVASAVEHYAIALSWADGSQLETSYDVERAGTEAGPFERIAVLASNATGYLDNSLLAATTYWYRVRARRTSDVSDFSGPVSGATNPIAPGAPSAPSGVAASPANGSATSLFWHDQSWNEDGFRIEMSLDFGASWTVQAVATANATSAWVPDQPVEGHLCYRVIAFNSFGDSPPSNTACTAIAAPPTNATMRYTPDGVLFTWEDNSTIEAGYMIWGCSDGTDSGRICAFVAAFEPNTETALLTGLIYLGPYAVSVMPDGDESTWTWFEVVP